VPHSPSDCIPANGWNITSLQRTGFVDNEMHWPLNRVVIEKNQTKQLVYYWFEERGRKVASENLAKWYLHLDATVLNRTDGALVRLVTPIYHGESEYDADQRLQSFMRGTTSTLTKYLPPKVISRVKVGPSSVSSQLQ
jgi:EpsI family protein